MKFVLPLIAASLCWAGNACVSVTGTANWSSPSSWKSCGGTTPQTGDTVTIGKNSSATTITLDMPADIGASASPVYGYVKLSRSGGTSGYAGDNHSFCAGATITGGTGHSALTSCGITNGYLSVSAYDRGSYSSGAGLAISVITTTGQGTIAAASAVRSGVTTGDRQVVPAGKTRLKYAVDVFWIIGSTQLINISGVTGSWSVMNGAHTATVVQDAVVDIDFDSSGLTGAPSGTIVSLPANPVSYSVEYEPGSNGPYALRVTKNATLVLGASTSLRVRGDVAFVASSVTDMFNWIVFQAGANLYIDGSASSCTFGSCIYTVAEDPAGAPSCFRTWDVSACTSDQPCHFEGTPASPTRLTNRDPRSNGPNITWLPTPQSGPAKPFQVRYLGDGEMEGVSIANNGNSTDPIGIRMHDTLWLSGGGIEVEQRLDGPKLYLDWNNFESRGTLSSFIIAGTTGHTAPTTGVRAIVNSVLDKRLGRSGLRPVDLDQFTMTGNLFLGGIFQIGNNRTWTFNNNFIRSPNCFGSIGIIIPDNNVSDVYALHDCDYASNDHYWASGAPSITRLMYQISGTNIGDSGELFTGGATTAASQIFLLPSSNGYGGLEFLSANGGSWKPVIRHGLWTGEQAFSPLQINETASTGAGNVTLQDTLLWVPSWAFPPPTLKLKMNNAAYGSLGDTTTVDVCVSPTACDYNSFYSRSETQPLCKNCMNQSNGYAGAWSVPPGTSGGVGFHDQDAAPPGFVTSWNGFPSDGTNSVLNWDQWYLGVALAGTTWDGVTDYAYGDMVSGFYTTHPDGTSDGRYNNRQFNYVCVSLNGCAHTSPRPGVAEQVPNINSLGQGSWQSNWLWGGLYQLNVAISQRITTTDGAARPAGGVYPEVGCNACLPVTALIQSMMASYAPSNPSLKGAAHDGSDIGPVPVYTPGKVRRIKHPPLGPDR